MISNSFIDSFKIIMNCEELSFPCKLKILEDILKDSSAVGFLGLELIEIIDDMLKKTDEKTDRRELIELKLLSLQILYYPDDFFLKNNIDIRKIFLDYLDYIKYEEISSKEAEILSLFISADTCYANDIEDHLLNFISEDDKILLLFKVNPKCIHNVFNNRDNLIALDKVDYYHNLNDRLDVLLKVFLVTHPQKSIEMFYMNFPIRYVYENICIDWYWTEKETYDYYVDNKIISLKESGVLCKIGNIIDNLDLQKQNAEYNKIMLGLFDEFIDNRTFIDIMFPDFLKLY